MAAGKNFKTEILKIKTAHFTKCFWERFKKYVHRPGKIYSIYSRLHTVNLIDFTQARSGQGGWSAITEGLRL